MAEEYALYSERYDKLPNNEMQLLAPGITPSVAVTERGRTFIYEWSDLKIICSEMPADNVQTHLDGFEGYVRSVYGGQCDSRGEGLIRRIHRTKLVVGIEIQPERDDSGRTEELIGRLCGGLTPLVFFEDAIYDWNACLILGPDGTYDEDAIIED